MIRKHGLCTGEKHPLFRIWCEMRYRCEKPSKWNYKYYGGKGIKVCDRWQRFENFVQDMGDRPLGPTKFTLDRIDRNGDYEPSNCRWASPYQQMNNHGINHLIVVDGEQLTLSEAGRKYGIKMGTIWARINDGRWSDQDAATKPLIRGSRRSLGTLA